MSYRPIAYGDRRTYATLCEECARARVPAYFAPDASDEVTEMLGEIYAHDLDPDDACPCDSCGACCCSPDSL
jgi:hypothetical protein